MSWLSLTPFSGYYAYAKINVHASDVRNVFQVKDPSSSNPTFYINPTNFSNLIVSTTDISNSRNNFGTLAYSAGKKLSNSLSSAYVYATTPSVYLDYNLDVSNVPYAVDKKTIKHDLLRNLSHKIFNTQYGLKILNNVEQMATDIDNKINSLFATHNSSTLFGKLETANGMDANNNSPSNVGRYIFDSLMYIAPQRFNTLTAYDISSNIYHMPFMAGDSIYFTMNCKYPIQNICNTNEVYPRPYQIQLKLV